MRQAKEIGGGGERGQHTSFASLPTFIAAVQFQGDSPQLRLLSVIISGIFLPLDVTISAYAAITHDAPGSSSAITAHQHQRTTATVVMADRIEPSRAVRRGRITVRSDDGLLTAQAVG